MVMLRQLAGQIPGGVKWGANGEGQVHCPFHKDKTPSCSINTEKGTFYCHSCGEKGVLQKLLIHCGIAIPEAPSTRQGQETIYDYEDAEGVLVYQAVRTETASGKKFKQRRPDGVGGWTWKLDKIKRLPYQLPDLLKALAFDEPVLIVEGEKCVELLRSRKYTATCNSGGALKWRAELNQYFPEDAKIYLIPDADIPGQEHMQKIGKALQQRGCNVFWIDLGFPITEKHGKDIADWIPGHTEKEFKAMLAAAPLYVPDRETVPGEALQSKRSVKKPPRAEVKPVKDYGRAVDLAKHFVGRFRWAPHLGSWMEWTGQVWRQAEEGRVAKIASDTLRAEYAALIAVTADKDTLAYLIGLVRETCIYRQIMAALSFLKGWQNIETRTEDWDSDLWALNVNNGIIDLRTGELTEHDPERLLTKLAPVDYNPEASGSAWEAHLQLFLPSEEIRRQVQRDLGMALVGAVIEEALPIWFGSGGNGKSTTTSVLRAVLGDYTREAAPNLLVLSKFDKHPTEIAELAQRRIIFSSEIGQGKLLDEQRVKELTGGGQPKKAHFMRQDNFEILQTFTIFMLVNHHPIITGTDHAIWRRVRLIPWTVQITEADRLPQEEIVGRLSAEGPAVLAWLIEGLKDWQNDRNWMALEVKAATSQYRAEQDRLGAFIADVCDEAVHFTVTVAELFEVYTAWCGEAGEDPLGKTAFGKRLKERGKISKKTGHENVTKWFGLRLKNHKCEPVRTDSLVPPNGKTEFTGNIENKFAPVRKSENDLVLVDSETLRANELKLRNYLDNETIPLEEREKRQPEYDVLIGEIARREEAAG